MNRNYQNFLIGVSSVFDLFPVSTFDRNALEKRIKKIDPPLTAVEAVVANDNALHIDWMHVGNALRIAAKEPNVHSAQ